MKRVTPLADDRASKGAGSPIVVTRYQPGHPRRASKHAVTHTYAALLFFTSGGSRFELNGDWRLREGDVLLVPAGAPHRSLGLQDLDAWGLGFCVACFASEGFGELLEPFERVREGASAVANVPAERREFLAGLFRELQNVVEQPKVRGRPPDAVQRSLLTLILSEIEKAAGSAPSPRAGSSVVVDALRFIERNCLRKLGLKDVARAVHKSPAYVTTALTRATGKSAVQWIVSGRMAEARRLLAHSDEMVDVISERVGYAHPTHFIRMFRREHGATPAAWRQAQSGAPQGDGRASTAY